ncbi:RDD family protein [Clostridium sp. CS001]|uniref:RDD family protein n=1 Tax=Clostridium sp. CS001 TaxID=2880648 RepID=UPI001CF11A72|nr:RDD family protein [Clostridium sp. CS001]MCB2288809.1 RDD family protein [Clostridium sp. CS001]
MLEQKETNENIIEELNDIENKNTAKNDEIFEASDAKEYLCCEHSNEDKGVNPSFMDTLKANLIDLIAIGGISTVGVFVADALLRLTGYGITEKFQMTFIIFMVVMVLYMSIMESGKNSSTLGKKIAGLIITKG